MGVVTWTSITSARMVVAILVDESHGITYNNAGMTHLCTVPRGAKQIAAKELAMW